MTGRGRTMQKTATSLAEVIEFAEESKRNGAEGTVYFHERETAPDGTIFADEDTAGNLQENFRLVLETADGSIYYAEEFTDMEFYKEALAQLDVLKAHYPVQPISEKELMQKRPT